MRETEEVARFSFHASLLTHHVTSRHSDAVAHNPTMPSSDLYQIVQIVYWLALATWFGGVLFVAISAPVILRTVRENNPILPHVLSVNLEGQHATLLAGSI